MNKAWRRDVILSAEKGNGVVLEHWYLYIIM